jgi:hypothetical protein
MATGVFNVIFILHVAYFLIKRVVALINNIDIKIRP